MKTNLLATALVSVLCAGCGQPATNRPSMHSRSLPNGLRTAVAYFPGSTNAAVFTFLPLGLASDDNGQAQWSHLVEHLVIRSTVPAGSPQANAETLPDHMRLDFYGNIGNWQEGLAHHRRWLEGVPFSEASLETEKVRANQECDSTARNLATHKFAIAAWAQGVRYARTSITLKGDVLRARLVDVQRLRDEQLVVSNRVTICLVGGVAPEVAFSEMEKEFGGLKMRPPLPASPARADPGRLDLRWDLDARHLLLTWPIPDFHHELYAPLMAGAALLNARLSADPALTGKVGMVFAGSDLATPEGDVFFVSASLRPGSSFDEVRRAILRHVAMLTSDSAELGDVPVIGRQLSTSFTELPDPRRLRTQLAPGITMAMLEGNLGLRMGMYEHRFGAEREALAERLSEVSVAEVQRAGREYLSETKACVCTLSPGKI